MIGAIVSIGLRVKPWNEAKVSSHQIPDFYNVIPKRTLRKVKPHQKTSRNIQHWAKWSQRCPNIRSHCVLFYCRMVISSLSINCCASREGSFLLERTIKMAVGTFSVPTCGFKTADVSEELAIALLIKIEPMSENIENLKSALKIRVLANTTWTSRLQVNFFKKWY